MSIIFGFNPLLRFIIFVPLIFVFTELLTLTREFIRLKIKTGNNLKRWINGNINMTDLNSLTPLEFEYWCTEFLSKLGYTPVNYPKSRTGNGGIVICEQGTSTVYIECKRTESDSYVNNQVCKNLVGAMAHDCISKGLIITNGILGKDALDFIRTLPADYEIEMLDGNDILKQYSYVHQKRPQTT